MPIFYQQDIDASTKLGIWKIEEDEDFFLAKVPLHRHISHQHKRLQHLAGRYLLQFLLPGFPVELIKLAGTLKPFLEDEAYHFSISHCGNYAAAILSTNKRVGVDIEIPDVKVARIRKKFLHEDELSETEKASFAGGLRSATKYESCEDEIIKLTLLWSCKEAVFKWWSYGKVDFKEQIRLRPDFNSETIQASFQSAHFYPLDIHVKIFNEICLAWVITAGESVKSI